ncbi:MAG: hypothetical protein ACI97N_000127 [Cognaticolwellia sp.]|jgi:hypothetical protein
MIPNNVKTRFEKIEKDRIALMQELSKYSEKQLNTKPADGGWSPMQVLHHLIQAEQGSLLYIKKKLSFKPELKTAAIINDIRFMFFKTAFNLPFKIKAPAVVADNLPETADFKSTQETWNKTRQTFHSWLETVDDDLWNKLIFKHPIMGRISIFHTLGFFEEHTKRHTNQIRKAL